MRIRDASAEDWPSIWPFFHEIVAAGETFSYDRDLDSEQGRELWFAAPPGRTVVAVDDEEIVLGSGHMEPNHGGPASHVATGSFMVNPRHGGQGVGRALVEEAIEWARREGYRAMQFNAVVSSNTRAVALWRSVGFEILATVPEGFEHPKLGFVGLHIMHLRL